MQAARGDDAVVQTLPLFAQFFDATFLAHSVEILGSAHDIDLLLDISPQHDIGTATGHIGCDSDHFRAPGLRNDLRFARVLLRVQDLMRQFVLLQHS